MRSNAGVNNCLVKGGKVFSHFFTGERRAVVAEILLWYHAMSGASLFEIFQGLESLRLVQLALQLDVYVRAGVIMEDASTFVLAICRFLSVCIKSSTQRIADEVID